MHFHLSHNIAMPLTELVVLGCPMALRRPFFAEQTMGSLEPAKNRSTHSKGHPRQPLVLLDSKSQPDVTVQYSRFWLWVPRSFRRFCERAGIEK
jgi:hypothetical protein